MEVSESEIFQNETLRPIIKAKNDFILAYFADFVANKKIIFESEKDKRNKIENLLKTDIKLKNLFIGAIISNFEANQLDQFLQNKSEYSKRTLSIIAKRIFDNL
jgi:hypothetical protein